MEHAQLVNEYLLPLQALLDATLDDISNYVEVCSSSSPGDRLPGSLPHSCNRLCYLTIDAKSTVLATEDQISEVIAL